MNSQRAGNRPPSKLALHLAAWELELYADPKAEMRLPHPLALSAHAMDHTPSSLTVANLILSTEDLLARGATIQPYDDDGDPGEWAVVGIPLEYLREIIEEQDPSTASLQWNSLHRPGCLLPRRAYPTWFEGYSHEVLWLMDDLAVSLTRLTGWQKVMPTDEQDKKLEAAVSNPNLGRVLPILKRYEPFETLVLCPDPEHPIALVRLAYSEDGNTYRGTSRFERFRDCAGVREAVAVEVDRTTARILSPDHLRGWAENPGENRGRWHEELQEKARDLEDTLTPLEMALLQLLIRVYAAYGEQRSGLEVIPRSRRESAAEFMWRAAEWDEGGWMLLCCDLVRAAKSIDGHEDLMERTWPALWRHLMNQRLRPGHARWPWPDLNVLFALLQVCGALTKEEAQAAREYVSRAVG